MVHAIQPVSLVGYMTPFISHSPAEIYPNSTGKNTKWQSVCSLLHLIVRQIQLVNDESINRMSYGRQEKSFSSGCTSSVNRNGRSQALNDSL